MEVVLRRVSARLVTGRGEIADRPVVVSSGGGLTGWGTAPGGRFTGTVLGVASPRAYRTASRATSSLDAESSSPPSWLRLPRESSTASSAAQASGSESGATDRKYCSSA